MTEERAAEKDRFTQACEDAISENQLVICAVTSGAMVDRLSKSTRVNEAPPSFAPRENTESGIRET